MKCARLLFYFWMLRLPCLGTLFAEPVKSPLAVVPVSLDVLPHAVLRDGEQGGPQAGPFFVSSLGAALKSDPIQLIAEGSEPQSFNATLRRIP